MRRGRSSAPVDAAVAAATGAATWPLSSRRCPTEGVLRESRASRPSSAQRARRLVQPTAAWSVGAGASENDFPVARMRTRPLTPPRGQGMLAAKKQNARAGKTSSGGCLDISLTMSYFHTGTRTIIGAEAFHCPVRDGKEWDHLAMVIRLNWVPGRSHERPSQFIEI